MTIRNHTRSLQSRARILAALSVTALALVAASPASAIYGDYETSDPTTERTVKRDSPAPPPVDKDGKKACPGGFGGEWAPHGTLYTTWAENSKGQVVEYTIRCNDGKWEPVEAPVPQPGVYEYDASGWSYVQP
jgi:hypothetical protein